MEKHIFISYKHDDNDFAEVLINRVEKAGFKTWVDHDKLHIGDDWRNGIDEAIKNSLALIVIMSPEAKTSEYVTYEWAFAWGAGVKVLPILHKATPLHPRLEALQYLDFTNRTGRPWDTLLHTIQKIADTSLSSTPPIPQNTSPSFYSASQQTKEFWLDSGRIFLERKDYQAALEAYKQAIFLDPHDANAYTNKSEVLSRLKSYKEALTASQQAIHLDAKFAKAWTNKGNALNGLKRYEQALVASDQAIQLDPNDVLAYNSKGNALYGLKRYEEALAAYDQAIQLDPNYVAAYRNKGITLNRLERYEEALAAFDQAIRLDPNDADTYYFKGLTFEALNRYEEALTSYDQSIVLNPNDASNYYSKAVTLYKLGRSNEAQAYHEMALQFDDEGYYQLDDES